MAYTVFSRILDSNFNFLILDSVTDTKNFGAIVRTAECLGMNGIIISKSGSSPINGETIKSSSGAIFNIPIFKVDHIKDAIFLLKANEIKNLAPKYDFLGIPSSNSDLLIGNIVMKITHQIIKSKNKNFISMICVSTIQALKRNFY